MTEKPNGHPRGRNYSRVYWEVMDDPKFDGVRKSNAAFGLWVRLLLLADQVWPVSPTIPAETPSDLLKRLVACGLVDRLSDHRYRIHGLDTEREGRTLAARRSASFRWDSDE